MKKHYSRKVMTYLSNRDPILKPIINKFGPIIIKNKDNNLLKNISRIIVGQQLSAKAARTIWDRIDKQINRWSANEVKNISIVEFRRLGLSKQKARYIIELSDHVTNNKICLESLYNMDENDVRDYLIGINGLGNWSIDMILIFILLKDDIFPNSDIALKKAIKRCYGLNDRSFEININIITENWKPYRSIASRYLWIWLDNI